jgi:hypothetical protein
MIAASVYLLCAVASLVCMFLLGYRFVQTRSRLLFWSALCFVGLALNNALLFIDLVVFPTEIDLQVARLIASSGGVGLLLFGFIWEIQQ